MEIIEQLLPIDSEEFIHLRDTLSEYPLDSTCFFDIETTGLSADISSLYLIGCGHITDQGLHLTQWFANDYTSEKEILQAFSDYIAKYTHLFHYNGQGFDIPYLTKKYQAHQLPEPFTRLNSIDLFRLMRPYKSFFPCSNLKLKTVEQWLHIQRNDTFSGKDCIELYVNFMKNKYYREEQTREQCHRLLLLHNQDDILGTFRLCEILHYLAPLTKENIHLVYREEANILQCTFESSYEYISPFRYESREDGNLFSLEYSDSECIIRLPLTKMTGYHFFPDYKNYYYLPAEDTAIHKSIAQYTDPSHRERATAKNCYTKKEGLFLSIPSLKHWKKSEIPVPLFYNRDKSSSYIQWTSELPPGFLAKCIFTK